MQRVRPLSALSFGERLNFLLTNRLPRRWLTLAMGRFSRLRSPLLAALSIRVWQLFVDDLRLHEAKKTRFDSLHDCFTRELKPGARPVAPGDEILTSPCDAVVGEFGDLVDGQAIQAKGFPYAVAELLGSPTDAPGGRFLTLRLKSSMYHRFHAPADGSVDSVRYISGDTWNVNPVALKVVERLFTRNERVVLPFRHTSGTEITLVAVAAILVASLRIDGLPEPLDLRYRGPNDIRFDRSYRKGEEIGYFEHGSTIVMLLPSNVEFLPALTTGEVVRMGQPILAVHTPQPLNGVDTQT